MFFGVFGECPPVLIQMYLVRKIRFLPATEMEMES